MQPFKKTPLGFFAALLGTALISAALLTAAQAPPEPSATLRIEVPVVNIYLTVKDRNGRLITDLTAEDFEVKEDGKIQEVRYFARETDRPVTMGLLVDTSISQQGVLPLEKEAASAFLRQVMRPIDLVLLITFDVNVDLLQDFTQEVERLERALGRARINTPVALGPFPQSQRRRGTALFDAVYLVSKQKLAGEVGRKAVIVLSDGVDAGSDVKEQDSLEAAQRSDTIIYSIGISDPDFYGFGGDAGFGRGVLKKLAEETGGRAYFPSKPEKLQEAFDQITQELRSQYSIGYAPTNRTRDGRFRKIEVKVKAKGRDLRVQARRGYYAPGS
ncbi:MAG: VWA domain-containing protein [Candidatus Acidiferrales bacterium]